MKVVIIFLIASIFLGCTKCFEEELGFWTLVDKHPATFSRNRIAVYETQTGKRWLIKKADLYFGVNVGEEIEIYYRTCVGIDGEIKDLKISKWRIVK